MTNSDSNNLLAVLLIIALLPLLLPLLFMVASVIGFGAVVLFNIVVAFISAFPWVHF